MTAGFWLDRGNDPLWRVHLPGSYTPEEFALEFEHLIERLEEVDHRVAVLIDVNVLRRSHPQNRERAARFFREQRELLKKKVVGWAFVTASPLMRGAIAAIGLLGAFPIATKTFDSHHAATNWLRGRLTKRSRRVRAS